MDMLTAAELWKDSNYSSIPLEVTIIKKYTLDDIEFIELYFTGNLYGVQKTRVYCRMARRLQDINPPVILLCDEFYSDVTTRDISKYVNIGYAVFQYDYAGKTDSKTRYTFYPKLLDYCNYFDNVDNIYFAAENIKQSCWYEWSIISLRTVFVINSLQGSDTKIVIVGIGLGGVNAVKTAAMSQNIIGLVLKYNSDLPIRDTDNIAIMNKATLGNGSYIPQLKFPTLLELASNESDGSFDDMVDIFKLIQKNNDQSRMSISVAKNHDIGMAQAQNEELWLSKLISECTGFEFNKMPVISQSVEDGFLYITVNANTVNVKKVSIYVSEDSDLDMLAPAYRYWQILNVENINENEYVAKFEVFGLHKYSVFASVEYTSGFCFATQLIKLSIDKNSGSNNVINTTRLIYDGEMDIDNWTELSLDAINKGSVKMDVGPFGIKGVSGMGCELAFFKIGDSRYKGALDNILQVTMYSTISQMIDFTAVYSDGYIEYKCSKDIDLDKNWTKILLSPDDFKGVGQLDWSKVIAFRVNSQIPIIISNVLWL